MLGSYALVFAFIAVAALLVHRRRLAPAGGRKLIHIGVSHWWLVAMAAFDNPWIASIGPASFIVINGLEARYRLVRAMSGGAGPRNRGTVWYPVSLLVLVNLCWRGVLPPWVGGIGVLIMGWGDGLAAVVGDAVRATGARIWGGRKTAAGSAAMFAASFLVTLGFTLAFGPQGARLFPAAAAAAATAAVATLLEAATPLGIDNITVPIGAALFYGLVFL